MTRAGLLDVFRTDRATLLCVFGLVLLPIAMFAINRSYIYTPAGDLDPWVYAGYHVHLPAMWRFTPWAYYGTRVPYTAVGYVIYRIFGTEPSLYVLAGLQFYVATFSLFYTIRVLFKSPVAGFVAACLLGTNSWFLWAIGWKYIDGPSIACLLFSFAALTAAARQKRWQLATLIWGASMAATAALYLMYVVLLPVEIVAFIILNWFGSRRAVLPITLLLSTGFVGCILLMGVVNWGLGGNFDYFRPTLEVLGDVGSAAEAADYYAPWHFWIWNASWLLFPGFAYVASWVVIATRGRLLLRNLKGEVTPEVSSDAAIVALALACVLAVSGFAFMQLRHYNVLQIWYHENILWPFAFLAIGACFARGLSRLPSARTLLAIATATLLCLAPWIAAALGYITLPPRNAPLVGASSSWLLAPAPQMLSGFVSEPLWVFAGAALLVGSLLSRRWAFPLVATAFLSMMSFVTIPQGVNLDPGPFKPAGRDNSLIIYDMARFIDASRENRPIAFWWDDHDARLDVFQSLGEMYISNPFIPPVVTPEKRVIFVASSVKLRTIERALTDDKHLKLLSVKAMHFQRGKLGIDVAVASVSAEQSPASTPEPTDVSRWPIALANHHYVAIPLTALSPRAGAGPVVIRTPKGAWQYAAEAKLPDGLLALHMPAASLHVKLRVTKGTVGVGVTTADGSTFLNRAFYQASPLPSDVYIDIPRFSDAWQIVISNGDSAASSAVSVYSIDIAEK